MSLRRQTRGIALFTALVMCGILIMMATTFVVANRHHNALSRGYSDRIGALYVAEAGVADALAQLTDDMTWAPTTPYSQAMENGQGSYTVVFSSGGGVASHESVNNLGHGLAVDGPRGSQTVPPNSVEVVVVAQVNGVQRRLGAILTPGAAGMEVNSPMLTSGKILLRGKVDVSGVKSMTDRSSVDITVHSNQGGSDPSLVRWIDDGETATIAGDVSSSGSHPGAVDMPGAVIHGGLPKVNVAPKPIPNINIQSVIAAKSSGNPGLPPPGTRIAAGDYYEAGDLVFNGDLDLDGANLYVAGKLTVHGSIKGQGEVFVGKETHFRGSSEINAGSDRHIALMSHGSVHLEGFDGTEYLDKVLTGQAAVDWAETQAAFQAFQNEVNSWDDATFQAHLEDDNRIERWRKTFGDFGTTQLPVEPYREYVTRDVIAAVRGLPQDETQQFILSRLESFSGMFNTGETGGGTDLQRVLDFKARGEVIGILDGVGDTRYWTVDPEITSSVRGVVNSIDYDRIGTSSFQGLVFSNGYIYVSNEVSVQGALMTKDDGSQPSADIDGETIEPGDLYLTNGSNITYIQEFFESPVGGGGALGIKQWLGR